MRVRFWGVRGSLPVPGPRTERYGGNTSCVEVMTAGGTRLVLDAGTGLRKLGKEMMRSEFESGRGVAHILISHTHWDHIQGLPFFSPLYRDGNQLHVYARHRADAQLRNVLATQTKDPYFPVPFDEARAALSFHALEDQASFAIDDAQITCARINHPYIATAYSIAVDGAKVVYVSDTAPFERILFGHEFVAAPPPPGAELPEPARRALEEMREGLVRLCDGADLVVYDTMFTAEDYRLMPHFGHSRPTDAIEICRAAGVKSLALFHHAPERSDSEVDLMLVDARELCARAGIKLDVLAAFEGLDLALGTT